MKRMLGVLMALLLFAAPAIAQSTTVAGDWELISIVIDGVTYEDLAQQGMLMTMRLEEDGTGVQTVNSDVYACTWTAADGAFLIDNGDGAMSFVLQPDGTLLGQDHVGDSMIFAPLSTAVDSAAGTWKLTAAEAEGIIVSDTTALGVELDMLLNADGTGTLSSGETTAACTWTQSGTAVTVVEENNDPLFLILQSDGTLAWAVEDVTLILSRTSEAATEAPESSQSVATQSEYGFSVQLPKDWVSIDSAYITQLVASIGEELAAANGFDQSLLDQLAASNMSLYYAPDMSANFNVVREPANNVTMENFASLEPAYQEIFRSSQGVTDFELSGPVDISGKSYYVGTFTAQTGLEQKQYYYVTNDYIYTVTLTNVSDSDAEQIMGSFEVR